MAEDEDFFTAETLAEVVNHFDGVGVHAVNVHGGALNVFAVRGISFACTALVPLNDGEVFLPGPLESSGDGHKGGAGSAVKEEQNGTLPRFTADFDPLIDAADRGALDSVDSIGRANGAGAGDVALSDVAVQGCGQSGRYQYGSDKDHKVFEDLLERHHRASGRECTGSLIKRRRLF